MADLMRLICPNCDAEYEVEAALIPQEGRDVQCSNCGHGWFQPSPEAEAMAADDEALFAGQEAAEQPDIAAADPERDLPEDETGLEPAFAAPVAAPVAARTIDASVLNVLREEAERESRARQVEGAALEVQGEMGLDAAPAEDAGLEERLARLKGEAAAHGELEEEPYGAGPGHKRQMLPEIDAINSTLRAKSEKRSGEQAVVVETLAVMPARSNGFRTGFLLAMTLVVLTMSAYLFAPLLAQRVPGLAEPLAIYTSYVDGLRLALDGVLRGVIVRISSLIGA